MALVAPQLRSGTELVRVRNALSLGPDLEPGFDWAPPSIPKDFKVEAVTPDPYFAELAVRLNLRSLPGDAARIRAISNHLLTSAPSLRGDAIQRDVRTTHQIITVEGRGYCGDFVAVFMAIAHAAGMETRPWSFSFDGFGGHGHIWVEVWNREYRSWQLIDVFQNYAYVLDDGVPLSALKLREALLNGHPQLRLQALSPMARPGWTNPAKAWKYVRDGLDEWYAIWGNNVTTRDRVPLVRLAASVSPTLRGIGLLVTGQQPDTRILPTAGNQAARDALRFLRVRLLAALSLAVGGVALLGSAPLLSRKSSS